MNASDQVRADIQQAKGERLQLMKRKKRREPKNTALAWAMADTPEGCCIACDTPLRKAQRMVHSDDPECLRTYWEIHSIGKRLEERLVRERADAALAALPRCPECKQRHDVPPRGGCTRWDAGLHPED